MRAAAPEPAVPPEAESPGDPGPGPRRVVPGIVYLGHVPPGLRPRHLRALLGGLGEVGRVFLRPEAKRRGRRRGRGPLYREGWVEFRDKRAAKRVVASLHNSAVGAGRRSPFGHDLWNLKYLHRFTWSHLSRRLARDGRARQLRLRAQVSQAKRDTDGYLRRAARGPRVERPGGSWGFAQRPTELELAERRAAGASRGPARPAEPWLARIFGPGPEAAPGPGFGPAHRGQRLRAAARGPSGNPPVS